MARSSFVDCYADMLRSLRSDYMLNQCAGKNVQTYK